jgi:hypothetical protein
MFVDTHPIEAYLYQYKQCPGKPAAEVSRERDLYRAQERICL